LESVWEDGAVSMHCAWEGSPSRVKGSFRCRGRQ
jgi:hypothetical protein